MDQRSSRESPGQFVRVGQKGTAWAFVPDLLPPELDMDLELVRALSDADRALAELAGAGRNTPNPHVFISPFVRREAVLSSRIEGTQATATDVYAFEAGQLPLPELRASSRRSDAQEVLNYVHALEYGLLRVKELPISLRFIRELHEILMKGVRGEEYTPGEFRRTQNWVGPPGCPIEEARFVPPPVREMHEALDSFERYLHAEDAYPPLMRLAFAHYQFEAIHPFLDGNGRVGRLLISLALVDWDLLSLPLLYLSAFFERYRQDYYDLLLAVSVRGAWREWVMFFLRGVKEQSRDALQKANRLRDLQVEWHERLARTRASALLLRLADSLFDTPVISIPGAQRILDVTYTSARNNVEKLVQAGVLRQMGENSYGKVFLAEEILQIVEDREI